MVLIPKMNLLYEGLENHGFNMPSYSSNICNKNFCFEIKTHKCLMFTAAQVVKHNVRYPPPIKILQ